MSNSKGKSKPLQKVIDYQTAFGGEAGQRVLKDLMHYANFMRTSVMVGDPYMTHYEEGKRDVVMRILKIMKTDYMKLKAQMEEGEQE